MHVLYVPLLLMAAIGTVLASRDYYDILSLPRDATDADVCLE